jgi:hypothetical protein
MPSKRSVDAAHAVERHVLDEEIRLDELDVRLLRRIDALIVVRVAGSGRCLRAGIRQVGPPRSGGVIAGDV